MAEIVHIEGTTHAAKLRSPVWIGVLSIVTLGIYVIFWWYFANREMADYGEAKGTRELGDSPGMSTLALFPGGLIMLPAIWTGVTTFQRVQAAQRLTGQPPINGWIGLILYFVFWPAYPAYMQSGLNAVWKAQVSAEPSSEPADFDRYRALSPGTPVTVVAAVLLLIDTFLDWQMVSVKFGSVEVASASQSAWNGFWGILLGLLTIALLAWLIASMAGVTMQLPVPDAMLSAVLGLAILVCAVLKGLTDDYSTVWAWIGVALAAVIAFGAFLRVQESGGMDKVRADASAMSSSRSETPPPAPAEEPPAS